MMASYKYTGSTTSGLTELYPEQFVMYGSSRLGVKNSEKLDLKVASAIKAECIAQQMGFSKLGDKQYEFSDHLGNVHMTISDRNKRHCDEEGTWEYNNPDILTSTDYYPGGYQMPERKWNSPRTYVTPKIVTTDYYDDFRQGMITTTPGINKVDIWRDQQDHSWLALENYTGGKRLHITAAFGVGIVSDPITVTPGAVGILAIDANLGSVSSLDVQWWEIDNLGNETYMGVLMTITSSSGATLFLPSTSKIKLRIVHNNLLGGDFYIERVALGQYVGASWLVLMDNNFSTSTLSSTPPINWMHNWRDSQPHCTMSTATVGSEQWIKIANANTSYGIFKDFAVVPGRTYTITYTIDMGTEDRVNMLWWVRDSSGTFGSWSLGSPSAYASGTHTIVLTPTKEILRLQFRCNATGRYFYMRDVSISHVVSNGGVVVNDTAHYAFGYNNQLKDNEIYGEGNAYTAEFWEYDPRSVRRWNRDPQGRIWESPYSTFGGNPISRTDKKGNKWDEENEVEDGKNSKHVAEETKKLYGSVKEIATKEAMRQDKIYNRNRKKYEKLVESDPSKALKYADKAINAQAERGRLNDIAYDMDAAIRELDEMGESEEVIFQFKPIYDKNIDSHISYQKLGGGISKIYILYNSISNRAHESKHAYQFLIGILKAQPDVDKSILFIHTKGQFFSEQEAYTRQINFSGSLIGIPGARDIFTSSEVTIYWINSIRSSSGDREYQHLYPEVNFPSK